MKNLSSLTRDGTHASCSGSARGVPERRGAGGTAKQGQSRQIHLEVELSFRWPQVIVICCPQQLVLRNDAAETSAPRGAQAGAHVLEAWM